MFGILAGFLLGFIGSIPVAGPISAMVFHRSLSGKFLQARFLSCGAAFAEAAYCALAIAGFTIFVQERVYVRFGAELLGSIILLITGYMFIISRPQIILEKHVEQMHQKARPARSILTGFLIAAANPALVITWATGITIIHAMTDLKFSRISLVTFPVAAGLGIAIWFQLLISLIKRFHSKIHPDKILIFLRFMGIGLIALSIFLGLSSLRHFR